MLFNLCDKEFKVDMKELNIVYRRGADENSPDMLNRLEAVKKFIEAVHAPIIVGVEVHNTEGKEAGTYSLNSKYLDIRLVMPAVERIMAGNVPDLFMAGRCRYSRHLGGTRHPNVKYLWSSFVLIRDNKVLMTIKAFKTSVNATLMIDFLGDRITLTRRVQDGALVFGLMFKQLLYNTPTLGHFDCLNDGKPESLRDVLKWFITDPDITLHEEYWV